MVLVVEAATGGSAWPYRIRACGNIAAGTCVLAERPAADFTDKLCAGCHAPVERLKVLKSRQCPNCTDVFYCSKKCKADHRHDPVCGAYKRSGAYHRQLTKRQQSDALLTAQILHKAVDEMEEVGLCGVHSLLGVGHRPVLDAAVIDEQMIAALQLEQAAPVESSMVPRNLDLRDSTAIPLTPIEQLTWLPVDGSLHGWTEDAVAAVIAIADTVVNWRCSCTLGWRNTSEEKQAVCCRVLRLIQSHACSAVYQSDLEVLTLAHEPLPGLDVNLNQASVISEQGGAAAAAAADNRRGSDTSVKANPPSRSGSLLSMSSDKQPPDRRRSNSVASVSSGFVAAVIAPDADMRALCPKISLLPHSCVPNCYLYFKNRVGYVVCIRDVSDGEALTVARVSPLLPKPDRALVINQRYHMTCHCPRCESQGVMAFSDVDSVARDLAAIVPVSKLIDPINENPRLYASVDAGMKSTLLMRPIIRGFASVCDDEAGGTPGSTRPGSPDNGGFPLPTMPGSPSGGAFDERVALEVHTLRRLLLKIKNTVATASYSQVCLEVEREFEAKLHPFNLYLYELRQVVAKATSGTVERLHWAKLLIFLSFIYKDAENSLERLSVLEQYGEAVRREYQAARYNILGRLSGESTRRPDLDPSVVIAIFKEIEFGYQCLFGPRAPKVKRATAVLAEMNKQINKRKH